jgi:hypothetical protein
MQPVEKIIACIDVNLRTEALGEQCHDGNGQFFTALSVKTKGMLQVRHWPSLFPLGKN